jgi:hypothetical protein
MLASKFYSLQFGFVSFTKNVPLPRNKFPKTSIVTSLILLVSLLVLTQLTACGNVQIRAGAKPDLAALEKSLRQGKSTTQDVVKSLGEPSGKGLEMLPFMDSPRDTWTYYYEEGDLKDDRRLFLFVFFKDQRYDGYMWFSSLPEFKPMLKN